METSTEQPPTAIDHVPTINEETRTNVEKEEANGHTPNGNVEAETKSQSDNQENSFSTLNFHDPNIFGRPIKASKLREHIQMLLNAKDPNYPEINGFDIEFNFIETQTAQEQYFGDYKTALVNLNKNKNRYSNVLPPEKTRVKLKVIDGEEGSDFINANFVPGLIPKSDHAYVASQGPLQSTFGDFWRMIWEIEAVVIVMLTKEVESGKLKCDRYWPDFDCPLSIYPFKVSLESQDDSNVELTTRKFTLQNLATEESKDVFHFQYTAWPDQRLPVSTTAFLDLAHKADTANTTNGPIVVHCSAGIGRTGTFCTVHSIIEKLRLDLQQRPDEDPEVNIVKTVLFMREQRPGMVQTREQYMFCYLTLLEECERLFSSKQKAKQVSQEALHAVKEDVENAHSHPNDTQSHASQSAATTPSSTSSNVAESSSNSGTKYGDLIDL